MMCELFELIALFIIADILTTSAGLKCRGKEPAQEPLDIEYAVKQCVRQMAEMDGRPKYYDNPENKMSNILRDRPYREGWNREGNNANGNKFYQKEFDRMPLHYNPRQPDEVLSSDNFYPMTPKREEFSQRKNSNGRIPPHSMMQQLQYEKDMIYNNKDFNNNNYRPFYNSNKLKPNRHSSGLTNIDAVDDNGKLSKQAIIENMTRKIRDPELSDFIRDSIEDCIEEQRSLGNSHYPSAENELLCRHAKMFALCMEDRGRQVCEDWDEPVKADWQGKHGPGAAKNTTFLFNKG